MSWPKVRLGELLKHQKDFITIDDLKIYKRARVQLHVQGIVVRDEVPGSLIKTKRQQVCRAGEFLVAEIDAKVGGFGIVPESLDGGIVSSHYFLYEINESKLDRRFLDFFIRTRTFRDQVEAQGSTNYAAIRPADVLGYQIPLPALPEQRRVVARIEGLSAKVKEACHLRQQAIEEAEALVKSAQNGYLLAAKKTYKDVELGSICKKITDGPHVSPKYVEKGIPFISVRNISETGLDFSTAKYISEADHSDYSKKANVEMGDVLYTKGGTTGVARRVDTENTFSIWVHVALLKIDRSMADAGFVEHMLNSPNSKEQAELFTRGSSNRDLGLSRMARIAFPLPPIQEQRKIASELDGIRTRIIALKTTQEESKVELDALFPSILNRAFAGQL
ncbi:MAG: restriction endonuclease subunit S [Geothrix sp.]|nr:restriction endonuclease subunit S [Geothrix sp.]